MAEKLVLARPMAVPVVEVAGQAMVLAQPLALEHLAKATMVVPVIAAVHHTAAVVAVAALVLLVRLPLAVNPAQVAMEVAVQSRALPLLMPAVAVVALAAPADITFLLVVVEPVVVVLAVATQQQMEPAQVVQQTPVAVAVVAAG